MQASTAGLAPRTGQSATRPSESARIAIYDVAGSAPRVEEVTPVETGEYISALATRTYELARAIGGQMPFSVISEVVENYIHAGFRGPVVTILDSGNTIRFSDQGPGIRDKLRALEPGYTTASTDMKCYIRGVGSGLPLVRECLSLRGGTLEVQDNLGAGAVVTVSVSSSEKERSPSPVPPLQVHTDTGRHRRGSQTGNQLPMATISDLDGPDEELTPAQPSAESPRRKLTNRQKQVLALVMDAGSAGPSLVARELAIGLSTAYRDLAHLETLGYIESDDSGKRTLTDQGATFLRSLLNAGA